MYAWLYVLLYTIVDFKSSLELALYVWFISTLNKALNWIPHFELSLGSNDRRREMEKTGTCIWTFCRGKRCDRCKTEEYIIIPLWWNTNARHLFYISWSCRTRKNWNCVKCIRCFILHIDFLISHESRLRDFWFLGNKL